MSEFLSGAGEAGDEGLKKLAASAALIKAILTQGAGLLDDALASPQLRFKSDGEIEAWLPTDDGLHVEMFSAWPNKFAQLAFGFACDHFKMLHEAAWRELTEKAFQQDSAAIVDTKNFSIDQNTVFSDAQPERMTAPALMAMCKRMASTPGWLMGALDDLEHGRSPFGLAPEAKKARAPR